MRIDYIDFAKGVAILLVVYGHSIGPFSDSLMPGMPCISTFHVPVFFFISGLLYKNYGSFTVFFKKRFVRILIPFIFFYLVLSFFVPALLGTLGSNTFHDWNFDSLWFSIYNEDLFEGPLWFLISLLYSFIIFFFINKYIHNTLLACCILLLFGMLGWYLSYTRYNIPCFIDSSFWGVAFLMLGYMSKKIVEYITLLQKTTILFIMIFCLSAVVLFSPDEYSNYMMNQLDNSMIRIVICSLSGIFFILTFSIIVNRIKFINYLGMNTMIILCSHVTILRLLGHVFPIFSVSNIFNPYLCFIFTITLYFGIIPTMKKFLPFLPGK